MVKTRPETISFEFTNLKDLEDRISELKPPKRVPTAVETSNHVEILAQFAKSKGYPAKAQELAIRLAMGYSDLLVVLLEPTNIYSSDDPEKAIQKSNALMHVDRTLRKVSYGARNLDNTCIFDVRPFRSKAVRKYEGELLRKRNDEIAYNVFEKMVDNLRPLVILICQCDTRRVQNPTAAQLSSTVKRCGQLSAQRLPSGHRCLVVKSFHPSHFKPDYVQEYVDKKELAQALMLTRTVLLQASFEFALLKAINALIGRKIIGFGEMDLQFAVLCDGPYPEDRPQDGKVLCTMSYHVSHTMVASPNLLRALAPAINDHHVRRIQPLDELLCQYRSSSIASDYFV